MKKFLPILVVLFLLAVLCGAVWRSRSEQKPAEKGRWRPISHLADPDRSEQRELIALYTLPYLQGHKRATVAGGVTLHKPHLVQPGLNFYNSGHAPEAAIMDMEGTALHRWSYPIPEAWRQWGNQEARSHWRRAELCEGGALVAIYDKIGLVKLDKDSHLIWMNDEVIPHHDLDIDDNGLIYVLGCVAGSAKPGSAQGGRVDDLVTVLNPEGQMLREYSILNCLLRSEYAHLLKNLPSEGELFHTNTLEVFDGSLEEMSPLFKKGNVLVAALYQNLVGIIDLEAEAFVWASNGLDGELWRGVHEPSLLHDGHILLFNNDSWGDFGNSTVLELDLFTGEKIWEYAGSEERPFFSKTCGTCQRLANGNTLITESDNGRAFEVTRDGEIVWEYINSHRAGEEGELIATLLHVFRVDREALSWLDASD